MPYGDDNQVDYSLRLRTSGGTAVDAQGVAMPGVCVELFKEPDHELIAVVQTDSSGRFEMQRVHGGLCRRVRVLRDSGQQTSR